MPDNELTKSLSEIPVADEMLPISEIGPADTGTPVDRNFVHYTKTKWLKKKNGRVYGHWESSFSAACALFGFQSYIEEGAIISLIDAGDCSDGDAVTKCIHQ